MFPGFIPFSRASLMLDVVAAAMVAIVPILMWSIQLAKVHKNYALHRKVQLALGGVLLIAVVLFEIDLRIYGWRHLAEPSRFYGATLNVVLYIHLFFSITTTILWAWAIIGALRNFDPVPVPNAYSSRHKRIAMLAAIDLLCTAITGWTFYVMAFVC